MGIGYIYPGDEAQQSLANSMTSYWSEFAYNGDPGQGRDGKEPHWLSWGEQGKRSIILDTPADQGIFMDDEEVVLEALKQALVNDPTITDPLERCDLYKSAFRPASDDTYTTEVCGR